MYLVVTGSAAGDEGEDEHEREVHQKMRRGVCGANSEALQHVRETAQRRDRGECTCTLTALYTKPRNAPVTVHCHQTPFSYSRLKVFFCSTGI